VASVDLKKVYREHYTAKSSPIVVEVPARPYLMIDGEGDPNTSKEYADAVAALYPIAYGIRKEIKDTTGDAYTVMPLEGLWWVEDMNQFSVERKDEWSWTMMICQPTVVTPEMGERLIADVTVRKDLQSGDRVRLQELDEGLAAQILHKGPYADEGPTIQLLHDFIGAEGYALRGKHHEIYLTDPRKSAPGNNRTILRQPVARP